MKIVTIAISSHGAHERPGARFPVEMPSYGPTVRSTFLNFLYQGKTPNPDALETSELTVNQAAGHTAG
jgi:hypothetical protein